MKLLLLLTLVGSAALLQVSAQSCTSETSCSSSSSTPRCIPSSSSNSASKSCKAKQQQGGFCDSAADCADGGSYTVKCDKTSSNAYNGVCAMKGTTAGASCRDEQEKNSYYSLECIATQLYCASNDQCTAVKGNGVSCSKSYECVGYCSTTTGKCAAYKSTGQSCTKSEECKGSSIYLASLASCSSSDKKCQDLVAALVGLGTAIITYIIIGVVVVFVLPIIICIICCCCCGAAAASAGNAAAAQQQRTVVMAGQPAYGQAYAQPGQPGQAYAQPGQVYAQPGVVQAQPAMQPAPAMGVGVSASVSMGQPTPTSAM